VQQVHQEYFNQMPKAEKMGLFSGLVNALGQNGMDPRQAGVSTTNPQNATSNDLGNLFNFAMNSGLLGGLLGGGGQRQPVQQQPGQSGLGSLIGGLFGGGNNQQPDYSQQPIQNQGNGWQSILSNPLAQAAISGLVGYAANRAINGFTSRNQSQSLPQHPEQSQNNWGQGQMQDYQGSGGGSALPGFENDQRQA
jgi:hypothetical protein